MVSNAGSDCIQDRRISVPPRIFPNYAKYIVDFRMRFEDVITAPLGVNLRVESSSEELKRQNIVNDQASQYIRDFVNGGDSRTVCAEDFDGFW